MPLMYVVLMHYLIVILPCEFRGIIFHKLQLIARLPGHLPRNCKIPGSMPSWGFLLLLFPWARNFIPIASATQLLNQENILCNQGTSEKQLSIVDVVIPVEKSVTATRIPKDTSP